MTEITVQSMVLGFEVSKEILGKYLRVRKAFPNFEKEITNFVKVSELLKNEDGITLSFMKENEGDEMWTDVRSTSVAGAYGDEWLISCSLETGKDPDIRGWVIATIEDLHEAVVAGEDNE